MKFVQAKPCRLHCSSCDETYTLPQNGNIKLYKELKCPLDEFELVLWTTGLKGKVHSNSDIGMFFQCSFWMCYRVDNVSYYSCPNGETQVSCCKILSFYYFESFPYIPSCDTQFALWGLCSAISEWSLVDASELIIHSCLL